MRVSLRGSGARLAALLAFALAAPAVAQAAEASPTWQFAPAEAPPPPTGAEPSAFPAALGAVGEISFWSPNKGLLITAGNELVPAGLYAWDGASWHQLADVCGGYDGRIAWAGPDEFWTISDQRPGQVLATGEIASELRDVSLCHFALGAGGRLEVVASYAMPLEQPDSYRPMDAAACDGPDDCWFGGALGTAPDSGAFHLYWNGSTLSVLYSPQDHAIASMAVEGGQIFESVQLAPGDDYGNESELNPSLLHTLVATDLSEPFHEPFLEDTQNTTCAPLCSPLPEYGNGANGEAVAPDTLAGLALSSDWSPDKEGPASEQLWAVAGTDATAPPAGEAKAQPIVLRRFGSAWTQIVPQLASFGHGEDPQGVAAVPGEPAAWITVASEDDTAHLDLLSSADGGEQWAFSEHLVLGPEQGVGARGDAGPIACPAAGECWLATSEGWLFHLSSEAPYAPDADPSFDGGYGVITYRPPDDGVPEVLPEQPTETEPIATVRPPAKAAEIPSDLAPATAPPAKRRTALVKREHSRVVRRKVRSDGKTLTEDVLELSFMLTSRAHVRLLASRQDEVVARTSERTLARGRHTLDLALDPKRWPTKLELEATPAR